MLTPTAGGKPIAIYTDGWEYHRARLAKDAEQRMALQRSGKYLFWALTWEDVVEKLPSPQKPLQPNGLEQVMPRVLTREEPFKDWLPEGLVEKATKEGVAPLISNHDIQKKGSLELLMSYLTLPLEEIWQGIAQQFSQSQLSNTLITEELIKKRVQEISLEAHIDEWKSSNKSSFGACIDVQPGFSLINLGDINRHKECNPGASFRAIHFDPEDSNESPHQQSIWREWIRQANLFQFLPHLLISTPGWTGAEQSSAIEPYAVWVEGTPARQVGGQAMASEAAKAWQSISADIASDCQRVVEALQVASISNDLPLPEARFELEGNKGEVVAEAELVWPEQKLAVVMEPEDAEAFEQAGWRCWLIDDSPDTIAQAILDAL